MIALGCDGRADCGMSASNLGFASVTEYMIVNIFAEGIQTPLTWIITFPLVLRTTHLVTQAMSSGIWQTLVGASLTGLVLAACLCGISLHFVLLIMVVNKYSTICLGAYVACFAIVLWALWFCFFRTSARHSSRCFAVSASKPWRRRRNAKMEMHLLHVLCQHDFWEFAWVLCGPVAVPFLHITHNARQLLGGLKYVGFRWRSSFQGFFVNFEYFESHCHSRYHCRGMTLAWWSLVVWIPGELIWISVGYHHDLLPRLRIDAAMWGAGAPLHRGEATNGSSWKFNFPSHVLSSRKGA